MQYKVLGTTGVRVSRLCLGTGAFGVAPLAEHAEDLVRRALDLGVNMFDTANSYGNFTRHDRPGAPPAAERESSQVILGRALKGRRHEAIICTKVREQVGPGINDYGSSRRHIMQQVENSLRALQTDYIDIYYLHGPDPETPLEQTMRTLDDLVRQGKIRYAGFSNFSAWQMTYGLGVCDRLALNKPVVHQLGYNLVMRGIEADTLPACRHQDIDLTCYFPLNGGLLAGRQTRERPIIGLQRFVEDKTKLTPPPEDQVQGAIGLETLSEQWGHQPAHVALSWLLSRPGVASAVVGPESIAELEAALAYSQVKLDASQLAQLDALCPPRASWETLYGQSQPPALDD